MENAKIVIQRVTDEKTVHETDFEFLFHASIIAQTKNPDTAVGVFTVKLFTLRLGKLLLRW